MPKHSSISAYLQNLQNDPERFQSAIEMLLEKHQVQPVGVGYIDLILKKENALNLIRELTNLSVAVYSLTWWCHFTLETASQLGCPHGYAGPQDKYGKGMFSECTHYPDFDIFELPEPIDENSLTTEVFVEKCNTVATDYLKNILPTERFYSPCLYPGLGLRVPDAWKRKYYWTKG